MWSFRPRGVHCRAAGLRPIFWPSLNAGRGVGTNWNKSWTHDWLGWPFSAVPSCLTARLVLLHGCLALCFSQFVFLFFLHLSNLFSIESFSLCTHTHTHTHFVDTCYLFPIKKTHHPLNFFTVFAPSPSMSCHPVFKKKNSKWALAIFPIRTEYLLIDLLRRVAMTEMTADSSRKENRFKILTERIWLADWKCAARRKRTAQESERERIIKVFLIELNTELH